MKPIKQRSYWIGVDQKDGFGFGGSFPEKDVYDLLYDYGFSETQISLIIDNGSFENEDVSITIEKETLPC